VLIDREGLHARSRAAAGEQVTAVTKSAEDVPNDFSFSCPCDSGETRREWSSRGLAVTGTKVFAAEYFTDSLGVIDLEKGHPSKLRSSRCKPRCP
jgi:hypothetical protein